MKIAREGGFEKIVGETENWVKLLDKILIKQKFRLPAMVIGNQAKMGRSKSFKVNDIIMVVVCLKKKTMVGWKVEMSGNLFVGFYFDDRYTGE